MTHIAKSEKDIAQELHELSDRMLDIAADLEYYGAGNFDWQYKSHHLNGASAVIRAWSNQIYKTDKP